MLYNKVVVPLKVSISVPSITARLEPVEIQAPILHKFVIQMCISASKVKLYIHDRVLHANVPMSDLDEGRCMLRWSRWAGSRNRASTHFP